MTQIASVTTAVSVSNTTTETDLFSVSLPGGVLNDTGRTVRAIAFGTFTNSTGSSDTIQMRLKLGSTTLLQTPALSFASSASSHKWSAEVFVISTGSNVQEASGVLTLSDASSDSWPSSVSSGDRAVGYGSSSETAFNMLDLDLTAQLGSASASLTVVLEAAFVEFVR